nr:MAG TPA: hypothetical protein [Caudoviricetes sp.]
MYRKNYRNTRQIIPAVSQHLGRKRAHRDGTPPAAIRPPGSGERLRMKQNNTTN